jgi:tripartite-type tricarboxylate transporter receptor subunit TctC
MIVVFAADGSVNIFARLTGQRLSEHLGQPSVIENRPGAAEKCLHRDGRTCAARRYTLLQATSGSARAIRVGLTGDF